LTVVLAGADAPSSSNCRWQSWASVVWAACGSVYVGALHAMSFVDRNWTLIPTRRLQNRSWPQFSAAGGGGGECFIQAHRSPQRKQFSRLSPCHTASWSTCAKPVATQTRIKHIIIHLNMAKKHQLYTQLWLLRAELVVYRFGWSLQPVFICFRVLYVCCLGKTHERYELFAMREEHASNISMLHQRQEGRVRT
jgi:hypothetical protein